MLADIMMDKKQRVLIMQRIAAADRGLIERFVAWLRETVKKFQAFMKNPEAGLTNAKIAAMNKAIANFARRCVDGDGKRIFSVTAKGEVRRFDGRALPAVAYSVNENRDNSLAGKKAGTGKLNNNEKPETVTRQYADIPQCAAAFVDGLMKNNSFMGRIKSSDDVDSVCDKIVEQLKWEAERQIKQYSESTDSSYQQNRLNMAALWVGMADEIRRDFNEGGQIYRSFSRSDGLRRYATEGSTLRESIRNRLRGEAEARRKETAAVDGYSRKAAPIVAKIREQDRGDGAKFSANLRGAEYYARSSNNPIARDGRDVGTVAGREHDGRGMDGGIQRDAGGTGKDSISPKTKYMVLKIGQIKKYQIHMMTMLQN